MFGLFIYVVLLRFWMQALRAPFRNPVGQFVIALSDWAVLPLRRIVPSFRNYDLASFAVAWLAQIAMMFALYAVVSGGRFGAPGLAVLGLSFVALVRASLHLLMFVVIVQVIMSLGEPVQPALPGVRRADAAVLRFRAFICSIGPVDLSPLLVVVLAQVLLIVIDGMPRALLTSG